MSTPTSTESSVQTGDQARTASGSTSGSGKGIAIGLSLLFFVVVCGVVALYFRSRLVALYVATRLSRKPTTDTGGGHDEESTSAAPKPSGQATPRPEALSIQYTTSLASASG